MQVILLAQNKRWKEQVKPFFIKRLLRTVPKVSYAAVWGINNSEHNIPAGAIGKELGQKRQFDH